MAQHLASQPTPVRLPAQLRRFMLTVIPILAVLHAYIGCRLLPALPIGAPGVAVGVIMLGLGLALTPADFARVVRFPRAVIVGLLVQTIVLVVVAFAITQLFDLPPMLAVGFMLLAASPGGAMANIFSHLAHGEVALNITLTAINSVLALAWLPLVMNW